MFNLTHTTVQSFKRRMLAGALTMTSPVKGLVISMESESISFSSLAWATERLRNTWRSTANNDVCSSTTSRALPVRSCGCGIIMAGMRMLFVPTPITVPVQRQECRGPGSLGLTVADQAVRQFQDTVSASHAMAVPRGVHHLLQHEWSAA